MNHKTCCNVQPSDCKVKIPERGMKNFYANISDALEGTGIKKYLSRIGTGLDLPYFCITLHDK